MLGRTFRLTALLTIFVGSAALVATTLAVSGVQYTWGRICYLIPHYDRASFWGPLLAFAILSLILQAITMLYCLAVVIRPFLDYHRRRWYGYGPSDDAAREINMQRTASRARKILQMQWRAIVITVLILVYVVYLASVLMRMRHLDEYPRGARRKWFECLARTNGDKEKCLPLASDLGPTEPELLAILYMLILSGLLGVVILFQPSMLRAWVDLFTGKKHLSRGPNQSRPSLARPDSHDLGLGTYNTVTSRSSSAGLSSQKVLQSQNLDDGDVETAGSGIDVAVSPGHS